MIETVIVGLGYWGPKIARNVLLNPKFNLIAVVEPDQDKADDTLRNLGNPNCQKFESLHDLIKSATNGILSVDLVIIAVPPRLHSELAALCIERGFNVLLEKPVGLSLEDAEKILSLSTAKGTKIFADFTFLHTGEFHYIKKQILSKRLGDNLLYFYSNRFNLGLIQNDISVFEDLMVHDVAILLALTEHLNLEFREILASGIQAFPSNYISTGFAQLLSNGFVASFAASWNSPVKQREISVCGEKGMIVWNDLNVSERIKIYSSEVRAANLGNFEQRQISYHIGDAVVPSVIGKEALTVLLDQVAARLEQNVEDDKLFILKVWKLLQEIVNQSQKFL